MERPGWAPAVAAAMVAFLLLSTASQGRRSEPSVKSNEQNFVFNYTLAKTIVEYASAVYMTDLSALYSWTCSRCNDLTQGFENWIRDLVWKQVDLNYPSMPDAKVHAGFYAVYNNTLLRPVITNAVRKARKLYGDISIIVTGHSMGGAMASFCALDLAISLGSDDVYPMTFGQPRIGNAVFASYFAKIVPNTIRVTHEHDIVPHLPPYFFFLADLTYHHFPREVWEHEVDGNTTFQVCDDSGEDPDCCRSVFALFLSASDHLTYMGVDIAADDWSTCRIVMGESVEQLRSDLTRNIIMSTDPLDVIILDHSEQIDLSTSS